MIEFGLLDKGSEIDHELPSGQWMCMYLIKIETLERKIC